MTKAELQRVIAQQIELKQQLIDYALDAEDDGATALEAFSAVQLERWAKPSLSGMNRSDLAIEMFVTEGTVVNAAGEALSVVEAFTQSESSLSADQTSWLTQWTDSFNGLFEVRAVSEAAEGEVEGEPGQTCYRLMNWLTEKDYSVWGNGAIASETLARLSEGEKLIARLLPVADGEWTFAGPMTLLGKVAKPKLAVAIGNFRTWFPDHLYGDASELKDLSWESVKKQYEDFVAFFGAEKVTLSGYELNKNLQAYQDESTEKQLNEAGIDSSKSLQALAKEAGVSEEDIDEAVDALGAEGAEGVVAKNLLKSQQSLKMVTPKVTLPEDLRRADAVPVFVHPRWGQTFLTEFAQLEKLLKQNDADSQEMLDRLVLKHLEDKRASVPVWQYLVETYPQSLTASLRRVSNNPDFSLDVDLDNLLRQCGKELAPTLPDSASVPEHLHNLFQEVLKSVGATAAGQKSGKKKKKKKKSGFGG